MQLRPVLRITRGIQTSDGPGVRLRRFLGGGSGLPSIDPFLLVCAYTCVLSRNFQAFVVGLTCRAARRMVTSSSAAVG